MAHNIGLSDILNEFTIKLFNKIASSKDENFFISPYSISTALTMCLAGAKSETAQQLKDLLHLSNISNEDILKMNNALIKLVNTGLGKHVIINTANKIYPNTNFELEKSFLDTIKNHFHGEIEKVDFSNAAASSKKINDWVSVKTNNKIKDLIPSSSIDHLTRLILVNAIYFKGNWIEKFNAEKTSKEDFTCANGSKVKVDMMKLRGKKFKILDNVLDISGQVCTFPYVGEVSMTIFLPNENTKLEVFEKQLTPSKLKELLNTPIGNSKVNAYIPKFKMEYQAELSTHFKELGITLPFDEKKADFSGITPSPYGLYISKVFHKSFVEVNEEGTEAAAATGVVMMTKCAVFVEHIHEFNCNRPFLFSIHDNTDSKNILFFGKYARPN